MNFFDINQYVILRDDMPEYELRNGDIGVVRNPVFTPDLAYEVDFYPTRPRHQTHAVVPAQNLALQPPPPPEEPVENNAVDVRL